MTGLRTDSSSDDAALLSYSRSRYAASEGNGNMKDMMTGEARGRRAHGGSWKGRDKDSSDRISVGKRNSAPCCSLSREARTKSCLI